jgi:alpha-galactosidase
MRTLVEQWRTISPNYYGDIYPLTPYSLANDVWAAMQFDRPEVGDGFLEVFRRSRSPYETARFKLQGLNPAAQYSVVSLDDAVSRELSGKELMESGIEVQLKHSPASALLTYKREGTATCAQ